jgi:hypothetical protein
MEKFLNSLFRAKADGSKKRHNDYHCEVLDLTIEEQNQKLVADKYYQSYDYVSGDIQKNDRDIPENKTGLPQSNEIHAFFHISSETTKKSIEPYESLLVDIFNFFEKSLHRIIKAEVMSQQLQLDKLLTSVEEIHKHKVAHDYFKALHGSFEYDPFVLKNFVKDLPTGVIKTNLLSKTWLLEKDFKNRMFKNSRTIIILYLYCRDQLKKPNIHLDSNLIGQFVLFCSRRDFMIELNETYNFEQNHPYAVNYSHGVEFKEHVDLFKSEQHFKWTIHTIVNKETSTPFFYHELCMALIDSKSLIGKRQISRFNDFLSDNFNHNLKKLRPSELSDEGKERAKNLILILNLFLKKT